MKTAGRNSAGRKTYGVRFGGFGLELAGERLEGRRRVDLPLGDPSLGGGCRGVCQG